MAALSTERVQQKGRLARLATDFTKGRKPFQGLSEGVGKGLDQYSTAAAVPGSCDELDIHKICRRFFRVYRICLAW